MRRGAYSEVGLPGPIAAIMHGPSAGFCKIRNLVLLVAVLLHQFHELLHACRSLVFIDCFAEPVFDGVGQCRAWLYGQRIGRHMLDTGLSHRAHRPFPVGCCRDGASVNQVNS